MKSCLLCSFIGTLLGTANLAQAALIATPITPYRSVADSPWRAAVEGGDAIVFESHPPLGCGAWMNIDTLPDGYGVYETFEPGCYTTPWMDRSSSTQDYDSASVDGDDGVLDGVGNGYSIHGTLPFRGTLPEFTLSFTPTTDGKLPKWFGFAAVLGIGGTASLELRGVGGGVLSLYDLTDLKAAMAASPVDQFQGFISDQEITSVTFYGGLTIDHFQYGYGAGPIPEPGGCLLLGGLGLWGWRQRRTGGMDKEWGQAMGSGKNS